MIEIIVGALLMLFGVIVGAALMKVKEENDG